MLSAVHAAAACLIGAPCALTHPVLAQPVKEVPQGTASQQGGAIISDADFNAALPALTARQTQPVTQPQATTPAANTATPATPPPAGAPIASDLAPVAPIGDAGLTAPLTPLSDFDTQPLDTTTLPASATPPQVSYDTTVNGLPRQEQDRFNQLSALRGGKGRAANASMVRARAAEDEALVLRLLKSDGYYDGTVTTTVTTTAGRVLAHLVVNPAKPYHMGQISIAAQPTTPPGLIRDALPLHTGQPIVADEVLAAEANVSLVLPQNGYPFAAVKGHDIALDPTTWSGDYTLNVDTGNRSRFGVFKSEGDPVFKPGHIAELTRFRPDDLYDNRKIDDLRQALVATSLFRSVSVEPVATGNINADGTEEVDLLVRQARGPVHTLAAEAGYSTGQGFTATGTWTNRNLLPPEGALILNGTIGTQQQGLGVTFRRSNAGIRDRTVSYGFVTTHTNETFEAYTGTLSYAVSRVSTPIWQKEWTWGYGVNLLGSHETSDPKVKNPVYTDYSLADVPLKLGWDKSDDLLNPTRGFRLGAQVTPEVAFGKSSPANILTILDGSAYHRLSDNMVVAGRVRLGSILGGSLLDLAPSRRLYAGGGGSVRGYAYQALGPLDASNSPTGGTSLNEFSLELRYRIGNLGIVPFIDAGQVYATPMPQFSDLRFGAGIGARMYTNFGPLRIDVATPLGQNTRNVAIALYVGIGQAF
ncbi:MAG: autotransporter assembly complex protein TamA [Asticcacaulis sp.]